MKVDKLRFSNRLIYIAILYVLPLILANVLYIDDMGRALYGYGWEVDGRLFASYLMQALSFGGAIVPMFPYSVTAAALIVFLAGVIVSNIIIKEYSLTLNVCCLLLLTSPFYLENLSYRYDAIPMAASILLAVIPFLVNGMVLFSLLSVISLFIVFGLYQTSTMVYFAMFICISFRDVKECGLKYVIKFAIICTLSFIVSYMLYSLWVRLMGLSMPRGELIHFNGDTFNSILTRIKAYSQIYSYLFSREYIIAILPITAAVLWSFFKHLKDDLRRGIIYTIALAASVSLITILTTMPNLLLKDPWYTPRTFVCYPFILIAISIYCLKAVSDIFLGISLSVIVFFSFVLSSSYGSVLKVNNDYDNFLAQSISEKIMKDSNRGEYTVVIMGKQSRPILSSMFYDKFPILVKLAPLYMSEGWYWGVKDLSRFLNIRSSSDAQKVIKSACDFDEIYKSSIYNLYHRNDVYIVDFEKKC
ncbi:TPA: hypothetical protein JTO81_003976 [Escherichia coli]|uniref:glucosyltransferase domain-containing protein n=1 Tax=Escherichia coli TaxID=562 RepID=UPI0003913D48|nr:glucosyltransferase domain-containing protein [Escherichia coli]EQY98878.1 hypothetical protein G967_02546 [Escherichia coli UMEA 3329-1]HAX7410205.1 hypothetical protein [Escherichia coli]HAX7478302.1 hypothetical protein [Escherichia coli]